jgi:hypothetical protein
LLSELVSGGTQLWWAQSEDLIEYVSILERHVVIEVEEMALTDMRRLNAELLNLGANCRGNGYPGRRET